MPALPAPMIRKLGRQPRPAAQGFPPHGSGCGASSDDDEEEEEEVTIGRADAGRLHLWRRPVVLVPMDDGGEATKMRMRAAWYEASAKAAAAAVRSFILRSFYTQFSSVLQRARAASKPALEEPDHKP